MSSNNARKRFGYGLGVRDWQFAKYRVTTAEEEEGTIEIMEADGWEYIATTQHKGSDWVVFKRHDGKTPKQPKFPVWEQVVEAQRSREGVKSSKKMTTREKLGKRAKR
jgi:hypothetical protein